MRIFTNLLLVLMLFWSMESKATCTPFTVSMASGGAGANATAFTNNGILGSTSGATYYLHWDNTYLYLGWSGGNTVYSSDMYYAALDLRSGGSSGSIQGVGFSNAIMDYYVVYENNASFYGAPVSNGDAYEVYQASGGSSWGFVSRNTGNDGTNGRVTFGNNANAEIRVRIPWSTFGGMPSSFKVVFWCNNSSGNYIWSSYPYLILGVLLHLLRLQMGFVLRLQDRALVRQMISLQKLSPSNSRPSPPPPSHLLTFWPGLRLPSATTVTLR